MGLFGIFRKKKKEDSAEMTEDEKQEAKAKEEIAENGADSQTEKDRIDESVAAQEHADGDEDSQTAKDRVDESEGAKKADEERAEDDGEKAPAWAAAMISTLEKIAAFFEKQEQAAQDPDAGAAAKMTEAFGNGNGVFQGEEQKEAEKAMTPAEVAKIVNKIM